MNSLPPSTSSVSSPVSSVDSPLSAVSSSIGSPGTPSVGYGPISNSQVSHTFKFFSISWKCCICCVTDDCGFLIYLEQINSSMSVSGLHAVSSSDDVKPPFGLKSISGSGPMLSQKRMCSICGDRSSGMYLNQDLSDCLSISDAPKYFIFLT